MGLVLGRQKEVRTHYPVLEITGNVDIGKRVIASLVSKRLGAALYYFPNLDVTTHTGRTLLTTLSSKPDYLEKNPYWWLHISIANYLEKTAEIQEVCTKRPVVVCNYTSAMRGWFRGLNIEKHEFWALTRCLKKPDKTYCIVSPAPICRSTNMTFNHSEELIREVNKYFTMRGEYDTKNTVTMRINPEDFKYTYQAVNSMALAISRHAKLEYHIPEFKNFTMSPNTLISYKDK